MLNKDLRVVIQELAKKLGSQKSLIPKVLLLPFHGHQGEIMDNNCSQLFFIHNILDDSLKALSMGTALRENTVAWYHGLTGEIIEDFDSLSKSL